MERINVLIVDDHDMVRQGLRVFLESEGDIEIVGEAADGVEAVQKAQEYLPDVVLMDMVMPGMNGVAATRQIKETCPSSRVIILTSFGEKENIFPSIKAGAMGYLLKNTPAEDLANAIRTVAKGGFLLHPEIASKVLKEFSAPYPDVHQPTSLTPREQEVLTLIAGQYTNKEIAQELSISIKTVKTHVSNILSKLHMRDRTQAAIYAVRQGLIPPADS